MTIFYEKKNGKIIRWTDSAEQAALEGLTQTCADGGLVKAYDDQYYLSGEAPEIPAEILAQKIRDNRSRLLRESDWTQAADAPFNTEEKAAWAMYRQALRDVPEQDGFPDNVVWPDKPE